jgi:flagellar hook-length control protein FliK
MELVAALPSELLAGAGPPPGGAAPLRRSSDQDAVAAPVGLPFELLLGLLQAPVPSGEALPAGGNTLPAAAVVPTGDGAATDSSGPSSSPPSVGASGGDLLARLRLAIGAEGGAPPSTPAPPADSVSATGSPLPFAAGDDGTPQVTPLPPTPAPPAAPPVAAEPPKPPGQELAAAIEALLPPTNASNRAPPRPAASAADPNQAVESPTEAVLASRSAGAAPAGATPPVAETVGNGTRPAEREASFEALLSPPATAADSAAPSPGGSAVAAPAHVAATHSPATSAPAPQAPGAPVDTRAEHWHEAFAGRVQWLVDQHVGEARIKLNPPQLGAVDVKISLVEDKTFVHLTAATSAARDELAQSLPRLRELLSSSGLSLGGATVQGGQTGHSGTNAAPHRSPAAAFPFYGHAGGDDPELVQRLPRSRGQIDLFA